MIPANLRIELFEANISKSVVFKNCENVNYLIYWLTKEMKFDVKIARLNRTSEIGASILATAFPGTSARNAYLVEIQKEDDLKYFGGFQRKTNFAVLRQFEGIVAVAA